MIERLIKQTGLSRTDIIDLLPFVLMEIRNYTKQYFLTTNHINITHIEDGKVYFDEEITSSFQVGDSIELMNSENNFNIYQIKTIDTGCLTLEQDIVDETNNTQMVMIKLSFKGVNFKTISDMISYGFKFKDQAGIKSQSLGGYNVTFAQPEVGNTLYPIELYGGLNSLKKLDDDFSEYRRKGYVRL